MKKEKNFLTVLRLILAAMVLTIFLKFFELLDEVNDV